MFDSSENVYIYQISTNPIIKNQSNFLPYEEEDNFACGFIGDFSIMTGMNNSLDKTREAIRNSSVVYITGEMDQTAFFELGLAISLNKKIYYVTERNQETFDLKLPYDLEHVTQIDYESFINTIDEL